MKNMFIFKIIIAMAIGCAIGYFFRERIRKIVNYLFKKTLTLLEREEQIASEVETSSIAQIQTNQLNNSTQFFDREKAKKEFIKISFEGIYESLYRVAKGKSARPLEVIADWDSRMQYLSDNIKGFWNSLFKDYANFKPEQLQKSAEKFYDFMIEAGVERDVREEFEVNNKTRHEYYDEDDKKLIIGQKMKVKFACWTLKENGTVLEKGILYVE